MELQKLLIVHPDASYDKTISIAIAAEYYDNMEKEAKKRKLEESSSSHSPCQSIVFKPIHRSFYLPPQQQAQEQVIVQPASIPTYTP
jgi:hypothetical protein